MDIYRILRALIFLSLIGFSSLSLSAPPEKDPSAAPDSKEDQQIKQIVEKAEALKKDLIKLNRELYLFEEQLLYPTNTQLAVFLSISEKSSFSLDSIELLLDDQIITSYLYGESEISALKKGGIQRLYIGSLSDGKHKLTAKFNGVDGNARYFRRKKSMTFSKEQSAKYLQLVVGESPSTREPIFKVRQW